MPEPTTAQQSTSPLEDRRLSDDEALNILEEFWRKKEWDKNVDPKIEFKSKRGKKYVLLTPKSAAASHRKGYHSRCFDITQIWFWYKMHLRLVLSSK